MYEFPSYAMELIATITDRGLPAVEGELPLIPLAV
jgi:hypothetical protein